MILLTSKHHVTLIHLIVYGTIVRRELRRPQSGAYRGDDEVLSSVYTMLYGLFPPTIHPMVVHFTIAILYLAVLTEVIAFVRNDRFYERAGFILLGLGVLATVAAGVAGAISEHFDIMTPQVVAMLATHRTAGELTGVLFLIVWTTRLITRYNWPDKRIPWYTLLMSLAGLALLTYVGSLGGSLVYNHGLGVVNGLGRRHL